MTVWLGTLAGIGLVTVAGLLGGAIAARVRQPRVIGYLSAGLLLTALPVGQRFSELDDLLAHVLTSDTFTVLGRVAVAAFMFTTARGLQDHTARAGEGRRALTVAGLTLVVPFLAGLMLAHGSLADQRPASVHPLVYDAFIATAMSATAMPVMSHILSDRGMSTSRIGQLAMRSAIAADVLIWCLLAVIVTVAHGGSLLGTTARLAAVAAFVAAMWHVARPLLASVLTRAQSSRTAMLAGVCTLAGGLALSSAITETLGVHVIFGAFLFGLIVPGPARPTAVLADGCRRAADTVLLPLFFTGTAAAIDLRAIIGGRITPSLLLLVLIVAVVPKMLGGVCAARLLNMNPREWVILAVLINCRGMTELVVLGVGLDQEIIGAPTFALLAAMALITTAMTGPLLTLASPSSAPSPASNGAADPAAVGIGLRTRPRPAGAGSAIPAPTGAKPR